MASQPHSDPCWKDADLEFRRTRASWGGRILRIAQVADPDARVWFGDHALPLAERGIRVLGTPLGHWSCVQAQLRSKAASHRVLLERIPSIQDLQSAWLLFLFCASPRANCFLRVVHPMSSQAFANEHDQDIWRCFSTLLGQVSGVDQWEVASVPQCFGGLGHSVARTAPTAHWASWADSVGFRQRHRDVVASVATALTDPPTHAHHLQGAADSRGFLHSVGFETAEWAALADGLRPRQPAFQDIKPGVPTHGWQFFVARAIEEHFVSSSIVPRLSPTESALLRSQSGPMAGFPFSVVPSSSFARFCPQLFHVLFRRFWLPLPLSSRTCRCGRPLDIFGHHCPACSRVGILGSRGFALESAAARVCWEGGGRVATNLFLRDLDVPVPVTDSRRLEVVCNGLPLFRGAQLALDTTLVSPVCSNGEPRGRSAVEDGAALSSARQRKARICPELCAQSRSPGCSHCRDRRPLVRRGTVSCPSWPAKARSVPHILHGRARPGLAADARLRLPVHLPCPCWTVVPFVVLTGQLPPRPWFSLRATVCHWGLRREAVLWRVSAELFLIQVSLFIILCAKKKGAIVRKRSKVSPTRAIALGRKPTLGLAAKVKVPV